LAEIATFTIPKIIYASQNQQWNAEATEAIAMVSNAYQQHKLNGYLAANNRAQDLTQYMNYVKVDSVTLIDTVPGQVAYYDCNSGQGICIRMHNGSILYATYLIYNGSSNLNYLSFRFDPDGVQTSDPNKASLHIFLYYNGRVTTRGQADIGSTNNSGSGFVSSVLADPPWFNSW
jgi:hypothetical protein